MSECQINVDKLSGLCSRNWLQWWHMAIICVSWYTDSNTEACHFSFENFASRHWLSGRTYFFYLSLLCSKLKEKSNWITGHLLYMSLYAECHYSALWIISNFCIFLDILKLEFCFIFLHSFHRQGVRLVIMCNLHVRRYFIVCYWVGSW